MDNKALKIGIVSGVISSLVVVVLIQPILSLIWRSVLSLGDTIHHGYIDGIYRNAALSERNLIGHATFLFVALLLIWMTALSLSSTVRSNYPASLRFMSRVLSVLVVSATLIGLLVFVVLFSLSAGIMEISASFTQRLTVLAPAINDQEVKVFRARWAAMRTKHDYDTLVDSMESRAKELSIELPPVRTP